MKRLAFAALTAVALATPALGQQPNPQELIAQQREAMKALKMMDGVWRGPAWTLLPNGEKRHITQTERIGPFLDGSIKLIEGRGYEADGRTGFNAFGVVHYDPAKKAYGFRSWALGRGGEFKFDVLADGYAWEIPFPGGVVKYVATINGNKFRETGHTVMEGKPPVQIFEMNLERVGDTDWPLGTPVPAK
jgi:hypothetical protein